LGIAGETLCEPKTEEGGDKMVKKTTKATSMPIKKGVNPFAKKMDTKKAPKKGK
jgi:hypothetical protein